MAMGYEQLELDRQLCFALYSASRAVVRAYGPLLERAGLTYPQYVTLLALWETPEAPPSVGELGARLRLDTGTLTPLLKRLEALGHLRRVRDTADERRVLVELTAGGLALREELASVPAGLVRALGLDVDEIGDLRDRLTALAGNVATGSAG
jgi:MarR family transcriptional regulator, organic hydroperoxide resistance regulator